jgi:hypothetical protein
MNRQSPDEYLPYATWKKEDPEVAPTNSKSRKPTFKNRLTNDFGLNVRCTHSTNAASNNANSLPERPCKQKPAAKQNPRIGKGTWEAHFGAVEALEI